MANKIRLGRATKARIETIKETLSNYELVYSLDTRELGVKNNDGTVTYFGVVTELEWANILNKPNFATVATSGAYSDLSGRPNLDLKLDKDFSVLPNQATPLLTDVMVINRGATIQRTTLGALLALVDTEIFIVVATLPATGLANKIYLIPHTAGGNQNDYEEYIWVNNKWENIGKFSIDLSNYYNKGEVDGLLGAKVNANNAITAGTSPKITYDAKGLVTGGSDLVESDIPTLAISKVTNLQSSLDNKVDKVSGKGLSDNNYTTAEKNKLAGIAAGAEVNVQSNWSATSGDALILNKPSIPTKTSDLTNDTGYITGYTETDPIFTAWDKSTGISITKSQITDLIEATQSLSGLMSATDKQRLDVLHALLEEDEANTVVDSINEVLAIFNNYPEGADLVSALAGKVDKNNAITAGTKAKITYDSKGLVTSGADLAETDIPALSASKISSGTFDAARIPNLSISKITSLQATLDTIETSKQDKLVAGENIIIDENTNTISASGSYININYADLVALRDSNSLKEGAFYRITDYETTTVQNETRSAGHLFDIIVQALDEKTLSENAQAIQSERDVSGYFSGVDLGAWKLKYTLDNDSDMYYWADTVNGKGVIYQMIDEWGNDLPYDFKNIQYKRYLIEDFSVNTDLENRYYGLKNEWESVIPSGATIDDNDFIWAYTFTVIDENGVVNDVSLNKNKTFVSDEGTYYYTKNNKIGSFTYEYYDEVEETSKIKEALGNNVILYDYDFYGYWEFLGFYYNTIGNGFNSNTIGNGFYSNTIGNNFKYNTIGNNLYYNTIDNDFYSNTIGNGFSYNTIGNGFYSNTIDNGFYYNTIDNDFYSNTIGNSFNYNTIGNGFYSNTIGNSFNYNTIGNSFNYNTIGNDFYSNTTGNSINYIQFSVDETSSSRIRNLYIRSGLEGASSNNKLDLYYSGLYHRLYPTYIEQIANGNIVSIHQETPLVWAGKKKITNTSSTWEDI